MLLLLISRYFIAMTEIKKEEMEEVKVEEPRNPTRVGSRLSSGVLQMNFMKRTFNQVQTQKKRFEAKRRRKEEIKVFPTVLRFDEDPVE